MIVLETSSDEVAVVPGSEEVIITSGEVAVLAPSPEVHLETTTQETVVEVQEPSQAHVYGGGTVVIHESSGGPGPDA